MRLAGHYRTATVEQEVSKALQVENGAIEEVGTWEPG